MKGNDMKKEKKNKKPRATSAYVQSLRQLESIAKKIERYHNKWLDDRIGKDTCDGVEFCPAFLEGVENKDFVTAFEADIGWEIKADLKDDGVTVSSYGWVKSIPKGVGVKMRKKIKEVQKLRTSYFLTEEGVKGFLSCAFSIDDWGKIRVISFVDRGKVFVGIELLEGISIELRFPMTDKGLDIAKQKFEEMKDRLEKNGIPVGS
jgi:hypothetical protein